MNGSWFLLSLVSIRYCFVPVVLIPSRSPRRLNPADLKIRLGEWDVSAKSEFYKHVELRVTGLYTHPDFYPGNLNNDLAVLRLEDFVDFTSK